MKHKIGNASDLCYRYLLYINQLYGDIATMAKPNFFETQPANYSKGSINFDDF